MPAGWQDIQAEALRRIRVRQWQPGERIPDEAVLAQEFGCARATVNRALRELAGSGMLERRRKGGTRVALFPVRKAVFAIPVIRQDVEERGLAYSYRLLSDSTVAPPAETLASFRLPAGTALRRVTALHLADGRPWCLEERWINPALPGLAEARFDRLSANEWLVRNIGLTGGGVEFSALAAEPETAAALACAPGAALFAIDRTTWLETTPVTAVRLTYAPGHRMVTVL
jgi:GntR family histidine utilization transcriptional repressor